MINLILLMIIAAFMYCVVFDLIEVVERAWLRAVESRAKHYEFQYELAHMSIHDMRAQCFLNGIHYEQSWEKSKLFEVINAAI